MARPKKKIDSWALRQRSAEIAIESYDWSGKETAPVAVVAIRRVRLEARDVLIHEEMPVSFWRRRMASLLALGMAATVHAERRPAPAAG